MVMAWENPIWHTGQAISHFIPLLSRLMQMLCAIAITLEEGADWLGWLHNIHMQLELKVYSLPIERNTSYLHESLIHPESSQSLSVVVIVVIPLTLQRDNVSSLFSILDENVPTEFTQEELK
jgi:hypothetical protein